MEGLSRNSLASQIADLIQQRINKEKLQPGDALGTEIKFAEELGVSRNIVREAIGRLRALGIVQGKQRTGLVVGQTDPVDLFNQGLPLFLVNEPINLKELAKLRYVLEIGAIDLAVENVTEKQISKMKKIAKQMAEMKNLGENKRTNLLEEEFHTLILQSSGSRLLARLHIVVSSYFSKASTQIANYDPINDKSIAEHKQIADAFERKDVDAIRALLQEHLAVILEQDNA